MPIKIIETFEVTGTPGTLSITRPNGRFVFQLAPERDGQKAASIGIAPADVAELLSWLKAQLKKVEAEAKTRDSTPAPPPSNGAAVHPGGTQSL